MIRAIAIAVFVLLPVYASDIVYAGGGAFTQIADGNGTQTTIMLVNLDNVPATYTLNFYDDNGAALPLSTTANQTPSSQLTGTLAVGGSTIIQTNGGGTTSVTGWGLLLTGTNQATGNRFTIGGTAVFGLALPGNPLVEASVPLDTGADTTWVIPFDHTTSAAGVAIANSWQSTPITVNVTAYDQNGTSLFAAPKTIQLKGGGHTSFMLTNYAELTGQKGIVVFAGPNSSTGGITDPNNPSGWINVLGLRATNSTLTSIIPLVPCNYNGTNCTN